MSRGMIYDTTTGRETPGLILAKWYNLRQAVGNIELKQKTGMKFKTRASTDLYDKIRAAADTEGILIYPSNGVSEGKVVDSGTLADVELTIICQAVADGSYIELYGYGQGADTQDKAGGKAGTYAFKQALIQACLAGGEKTPKKDRIPDTDDEDAPIPGGVKPKSGKPSAEAVKEALTNANDEPSYRAAVELLKQVAPEQQVAIKPIAVEAKARCIPQPTA